MSYYKKYSYVPKTSEKDSNETSHSNESSFSYSNYINAGRSSSLSHKTYNTHTEIDRSPNHINEPNINFDFKKRMQTAKSHMNFVTQNTPKCAGCNKTVYFAEKITCLNKPWHRNCLRCTKCNKILTLGNVVDHDDKPYCELPCYNFLFGPKGKYFWLKIRL